MESLLSSISPFMDLGLGALALLLYHRLSLTLTAFTATQKTLLESLTARLTSHETRIAALESKPPDRGAAVVKATVV